ncbi:MULTISPECIES: amidase [Pseudonocardia]|uniref:Amidase n=2 Tax=Pseudonocardia TaxID=1847 RepID=A0A1Y2MK97_PSEAH|nr:MULTISPECIES: amidase [Pseudonocardia]OSY35592.1 Amidase [Pseudonocardia autotrophica]TDN76883.1 amidase [Pseudonocardia autotrophica]BBG00886.1 amidase [Pseudonocardia autotrophica]GEC27555.1 amidase [Pseudonocardia saturnea]
MAIPPPDAEQLAAINSQHAFGLSEAELAEFGPAVTATLSAPDRVEELYRASAPHTPERDWSEPADNPLGGWYVTTSIPPTTDGPLTGRTVALKDNIALAGVPMTNGSATVEGFIPRRDATVATRLLAAGATITGKAVCEDLCFSGASFTSRPWPVRNPWDLTRVAGGSSSGSAALVAAGTVDLAIGGDQGGSIRIPSAFCGTVGHKPTHGLVPYTGAFPIEATIDHLGPITRTVTDAALMLGVLAGIDGLDARQPSSLDPIDYLAALQTPTTGLRIGIVTEGFARPESDLAVDDTVHAAITALTRAGLTAEQVSIPWHLDGMAIWNVIATEGAAHQMISGNAYGMNYPGLYDPELIAHYARQRRTRGAELSKTVKLVGLSGSYTAEHGGGSYYAMARNLALDLRAAYDHALNSYDVLVMPTLPYTAPELIGLDADLDTYLPTALGMVGNCAPFDVTGHPAASVPAGLVNGLPTGLMIIGRRFDDATVLRVAHTFEQAVGGFPGPPAHAAAVGAARSSLSGVGR